MEIIELIKDCLPSLTSGLLVTMEISIISLIIAVILGIIFGVFSISKSKILKSYLLCNNCTFIKCWCIHVRFKAMLPQSKPDVNSFKVKNATKGNKDGRIDGVKEH